jgi:phosphoglycolate phosphatase
MRRRDLLIFDLDGTLVDSKLDLVNSVNATRAWMDLEPLSEQAISSYVGNGAPVLIQRVLPGASPEQLKLGLRYFLDYYREHMLDSTTLYRGVRDALEQLHSADVPMAILTNKPVRFSVHMMEGLGLDTLFFRIYGGNSFAEKKPDPLGVNLLVEESGADRELTVMVGDSAVDVLTARNARVRSCGVKWGFQPETFAEAPPDLLIGDLRELVSLVCGR